MTSLADRTQAWAEARTGRFGRLPLLGVRTIRDAFDDRVFGLAAEVAFYMILSLPPLLVTVVATVGLVGNTLVADFQARTLERIQEVAGTFLTSGATADLTSVVDRVLDQARPSVLSVGFVLTLLAASRAFRVMTVAITIAYDLEDARQTWKQFVYGIAMTFGAIVVGLLVLPLFVGGPGLGEVIGAWFGLEAAFGAVWRIAYWPAAVVVLGLLISLLYHVAAPWWTPWRRDLPGAVLATVLALLGSVGLRFYAAAAISGDDVYQPIAAPLVLLLWLYVLALAVLLGAELNAEVERMWPSGDDAPAADPNVRPAGSEAEDAAPDEVLEGRDAERIEHGGGPRVDADEVARPR